LLIHPLASSEMHQEEVDLDLAYATAIKAAKGAGDLIRKTFRT
jgi:hypothetical protein